MSNTIAALVSIQAVEPESMVVSFIGAAHHSRGCHQKKHELAPFVDGTSKSCRYSYGLFGLVVSFFEEQALQ